jgi:ATP-dependent helicase/DNAse subunit B
MNDAEETTPPTPSAPRALTAEQRAEYRKSLVERESKAQEEYDRTLDYGYERAIELMQQRVLGITSPAPLKGAVDGCEYCGYASACGYDRKGSGRESQKMDRTLFLAAIAKGGDSA